QSLSSCPELRQVRNSSIQQGYERSVFHYLGMCHYCYLEPSEDVVLKTCSKCKIVAYCTRECQYKDRKSHKTFCKVFPLRVNFDELAYPQPNTSIPQYIWFPIGTNSNNIFIKDITEHPYRLNLIKQNGNRIRIEINDVIRYCRHPNCPLFESRCSFGTKASQLHSCECLDVSYCSQGHQGDDIEHREVCNKSYIMMNSYTRNNSTLSIPYMRAYPASNKYIPLRGGETQITENIISEITEAMVKEDIVNDKWNKTQVEILRDRLAIPFTILYCLQKFGVGEDSTPLAEVTKLNIHILTAMPLFDPQMWELLLHRLPALKELNITYIGCSGLNWNPINVYNTMMKLERCEDCETRDRVISIKVQVSHYHMYFSAEDYVEPDVVAIFGCHKKLLDIKYIDEEDVNEFTSLRNMTYNKDTLLILTDYEESWVEDAIEEVNHARPINILMPVIKNPLKAEGHIESIKIQGLRYNILRYLTCVQRR
ncbi:unnamed protein product, partial [Meganyctiphanes norvegica]